ncbi:hypothetical protein BofuT4_P073690.1 [Botrytis cinerea T4]|uniref:Uncharacterized protein n=1 Tax=Botryotinia fuckeliana (strain T4) TaxID=999810 RepID=G2XPF1_BOTF4|nr:hypothetical protein BofuT4_P073690.1 [Botrytis cinerea T4]
MRCAWHFIPASQPPANTKRPMILFTPRKWAIVSRRHRIVLHDQSINQTISVPPSKVRQVPAEDF